jgi:hypothetical protein
MCSTTRRRPESLLPDPVCASLVPTARAIWIASSALTTLLSSVQTGLSLVRNPEDRLELRSPLDNLAGNSVAKGLNLLRDGQVLVQSGKRKVAISSAQYRANGIHPPMTSSRLKLCPRRFLKPGSPWQLSQRRTKAWLEDRRIAAAQAAMVFLSQSAQPGQHRSPPCAGSMARPRRLGVGLERGLGYRRIRQSDKCRPPLTAISSANSRSSIDPAQ